MATTTNFGWETPDDTDLVKDGAAAMRTLGNSIDTSFVDLKGGTTNQVLAKNSNTDLDFKWVADATGIPATIFDAKGDIIAATAADTADRLAVGANNTVLTADSTTATGLKWASVATSKNFSLLNSGGTSLTGATTITVSGISGIDQILVVVVGSSAGSNSDISLRFNADSTSNYVYSGTYASYGSTYSQGNYSTFTSTTGTDIRLGNNSDGAGTISGTLMLSGCNSSGVKAYQSMGGAGGGDVKQSYFLGGVYKGSSTISSVSIVSNIGNFDNGTIYIYGAA